jgi:cyclase
VGGGISELKDIELLLKSGADKVSLNSAIVKNPRLITEASRQFGSQAVVAAIDIKQINKSCKIFIKGGREEVDLDGMDWCRRAAELGAGEILLTSMDKDGTKSGYDIKFLKELTSEVPVPVIASGGAGKKEDFLDAFKEAGVDACLAASLFHFNILPIKELKKYLQENNIIVRL